MVSTTGQGMHTYQHCSSGGLAPVLVHMWQHLHNLKSTQWGCVLCTAGGGEGKVHGDINLLGGGLMQSAIMQALFHQHLMTSLLLSTWPCAMTLERLPMSTRLWQQAWLSISAPCPQPPNHPFPYCNIGRHADNSKQLQRSMRIASDNVCLILKA